MLVVIICYCYNKVFVYSIYNGDPKDYSPNMDRKL